MEFPGLRRLLPVAVLVGVVSLGIHYVPSGTAESDALVTALTAALAALGWGTAASRSKGGA